MIKRRQMNALSCILKIKRRGSFSCKHERTSSFHFINQTVIRLAYALDKCSLLILLHISIILLPTCYQQIHLYTTIFIHN